MKVCFDFETYWIQPGMLAPPVVCGAFKSPDQEAVFLLRDQALDRTHFLLEDSSTYWVGHNIAYDFGCYLRHRPEDFPLVWKAYEESRVFDTKIAATLHAIAEGRLQDGALLDKNGRRAVDPAKGVQTNRYSLALVVKEWLGRNDAKVNAGFVSRYQELEGISLTAWPPEAIQYPKDDVTNTLEAHEAMLMSAQNLHCAPFHTHAAFCLHLGAINGWRTSAPRVEALKVLVESTKADLLRRAQEAGFLKPNKKNKSGVSKDTKVIKARVEALWGALVPKTETGETSISRETLTDSGDESLAALGELSKWEKFSTYIPSLEAGTLAPLTVECNPLLATGRTSYEGLVQLMPRKGGVRECFEFRGVGSSVDYAAVELSTLAQVCIWRVGHSALGDAINNGMDPHSLLGAQLTGSKYEDFLQRVKQKDPVAADLRQAGKAANFGFPGGMGEATFVLAKRREGLKVCELFYRDGKCGEVILTEWNKRATKAPTCERCLKQTRELKNAWFNQWTEMRPYLRGIGDHTNLSESVETFGTKMVRGGITYTSAANHFFQSLAAVGAKRAVIQMTKEMYSGTSPLLGSRLCLFAHDETLIDIPDKGVDWVDAAARRQVDVMVEAMRSVTPDVKISAEPALMKFWSKEAKTVQDAKGRYIRCDYSR